MFHMKSQQFLWFFWAIPSRMFWKISFSLLRCQICFRKKPLLGGQGIPFFLLGILIISRGERGLVRLLSISHPVEASLVFC